MSLHRAVVSVVLLGPAVGVPKQALAQTIAEFPIPITGGGPYGMASGPDGALRFTEGDPNADKIGRITTAEVILIA